MGTYDNLVAKLEETAENLERMCCDELQIAIGAIRKRTPLLPVVKGDVRVYCPSCGRQIRSGNGKSSVAKKSRDLYCCWCGQAIRSDERKEETNVSSDNNG